MTKKQVRSQDRQLAKLEAKKEKEISACCDHEFLLNSLAILAAAVEHLYMTHGHTLPGDAEKTIRNIKARNKKILSIIDRKDTLETAIRSGRFANLDAEW